jgi:putative nucleotidyltransferase with HDIG domain
LDESLKIFIRNIHLPRKGSIMITPQQIKELFKDFLSLISDPKLADKVVEVWVAGCKQGNWTSIEELEKIPFTLLTETRGINLIEHTLAVTQGALELAKAQEKFYSKMPYPVDMDRLIAGGLLHDVGKLLEIEKSENKYQKSYSGKCARHPVSGAILAAMAGLSEEIVNTIACHAKEGDGRPQVLETVLIHQADFATFNPLVMMAGNNLIIQ